MMSALDRSNIGNANLTTFKEDIGLVGNQFGYCVSVLYATYVFFEPFWAVSLKVASPRYLCQSTDSGSYEPGLTFSIVLDYLLVSHHDRIGLRIFVSPCHCDSSSFGCVRSGNRALHIALPHHGLHARRIRQATDVHQCLFCPFRGFRWFARLWSYADQSCRSAWMAMDVPNRRSALIVPITHISQAHSSQVSCHSVFFLSRGFCCPTPLRSSDGSHLRNRLFCERGNS